MTNWCSSTITVHADQSVLSRIRREAPVFSLERLVPVPPILRGIVSERDWHGREERTRSMRLFARDGAIVREPVPDDELTELTSMFGATNADDWSRQAWGTAYDVYPGPWEAGDGALRAYAETPWSPPNIAVQTLSQRYPAARFELSFHIEAIGWGDLAYENGVEVANTYTEYDWDAIYADEARLREQERQQGAPSAGPSPELP